MKNRRIIELALPQIRSFQNASPTARKAVTPDADGHQKI